MRNDQRYEFGNRKLSIITEIEKKYEREIHRVFGFFITRVIQHLADGRKIISHSRRHRKGLPPIRISSDGIEVVTPHVDNPWLRLWAPSRLPWWIALLFIIGAGCFALGGFASNWPQCFSAGLADSRTINNVFFIGSLFFTSAALLQVLEAINGDVADVGICNRRWRWFAWKPQNAGYSSSLVQFVGTLLFNFNTADAMISNLNWLKTDILVWIPDFIGSICFLVASYLALIEVSHNCWSFKPWRVSWWIVVINLMGSIAFMLSATFSFLPPPDGISEWAWGSSFFTMTGAVCFFVASYLMIPELFGADNSTNILHRK